MGIRLHLDNLPSQYQKKLKSRGLTKETIDSLASSISHKYVLQKNTLKRTATVFSFIPFFLALLGLFGTSGTGADMTVFILSCMFALVMELVIFVGIYFIAVTRVPRQFSRCLKTGYPELEMIYGYEAITDGSLITPHHSRQFSFYLYVENVLDLKDCNYIVVTGFAHGLIQRNHSVCIACGSDPSPHHDALMVTGIETASGTPSAEASDCPAALRLKNGKSASVRPGMYLYRQEL